MKEGDIVKFIKLLETEKRQQVGNRHPKIDSIGLVMALEEGKALVKFDKFKTGHDGTGEDYNQLTILKKPCDCWWCKLDQIELTKEHPKGAKILLEMIKLKQLKQFQEGDCNEK